MGKQKMCRPPGVSCRAALMHIDHSLLSTVESVLYEGIQIRSEKCQALVYVSWVRQDLDLRSSESSGIGIQLSIIVSIQHSYECSKCFIELRRHHLTLQIWQVGTGIQRREIWALAWHRGRGHVCRRARHSVRIWETSRLWGIRLEWVWHLQGWVVSSMSLEPRLAGVMFPALVPIL